MSIGSLDPPPVKIVQLVPVQALPPPIPAWVSVVQATAVAPWVLSLVLQSEPSSSWHTRSQSSGRAPPAPVEEVALPSSSNRPAGVEARATLVATSEPETSITPAKRLSSRRPWRCLTSVRLSTTSSSPDSPDHSRSRSLSPRRNVHPRPSLVDENSAPLASALLRGALRQGSGRLALARSMTCFSRRDHPRVP